MVVLLSDQQESTRCKMALQAKNKFRSPKNRCRICLEGTNGKIKLNQTIHYKETGILLTELLEFCVNEQVYETGHADELCLSCMQKGMVCYEFKKLYEVSQKILFREMEENNGFSLAIKIEPDFDEENFMVQTENIVIKEEILNEEEIEYVLENLNKCDECGKIYNSQSEMLCHKRQHHMKNTYHPQPRTKKIDKTIPTCATECDEPASTLPTDQPALTFPTLQRALTFPNDQAALIFPNEQPALTFPSDQPALIFPNDQPALTFSGDQPASAFPSDQPASTFPSDKPTSAPLDDQPIIPLRLEEVAENKCDLCEKTFKVSSSLDRHKLTHIQITKSCSRCSYAPETSEALVQHMENVHQQIVDISKQIPCPTCGKIFFNKRNYSLHKLIHTNFKKHTCEFCGMSFTFGGNLVTHRRIHTGEKPYSCKECGKRFTQRSSWKSHQIVHSKKRNHVCQKCDATFARSGDLSVHMLTHTGEQNFACDFCGKKFNRISNLNVHRKIHTGRVLHTCEICGKVFKQAHWLKTHLKTHETKTN